jgi:hypothetical protein
MEIKLKHELTLIIDDEDYYELFLSGKYGVWYAKEDKKGHNWYCVTNGNNRVGKKHLKIHRIITGVEDRKVVIDHLDHNGLNNQRNNLRICTQFENQHNRKSQRGSLSQYKGVTLSVFKHTKKNGELVFYKKWKATIRKDGKNKNLGYFLDQESAALAYDKAAIELHGEFAYLNFTDKTQNSK